MLTNSPSCPYCRSWTFLVRALSTSSALASCPSPRASPRPASSIEIDLRDRPSKAEHTAISFEVDDLEREVTDLERHGVRFEDYDLPGLKTDHHIAQIDGMLAAWFKDPDGNILCVHQQGARSH